ncbi:glycosyltransferase 87 family protein [Methylobacterium komagatae]|uniref:Glycosyltransferase 87 family protein n=1 Tax=Methylobacterium komagatae TaxID=374425 RepID=A0ABW2BQJ9_9HYPH
MTSPLARLTGLGLLLALIMLGALMLHVPGADTVGSPERANIFVAVLALGVAVYFVAVRLVLRTILPPQAFWIIIGIAFALRAALLPSLPFLSSDIYRYVWDGQVQAAGINPYRYLPVDPALAHLRDPAVFPWINRATYALTIYPPAAQAVFALVGVITPTVLGMKVAMVCFEALAVLCLLRVLALARLPRERVLLYAWNPLALWSFACDGHVDAIAIGLLAVALLCRARAREGLAGAMLAAAILVKFLPVAAAPALLRGGRFWKPVLAGLLVIVLLYAPYLSVGSGVLGFLSAYGDEEGYRSGKGFWLLSGMSHLVPLPDGAGRIYLICAAILLGALAFWIARRPALRGPAATIALCRDTAILVTCTTAAANPHYAWYYAWLALPAVVAPIPAVVWLSAAPVLFYVDPFNERFLWPSLVFVPALALALRGLLQARAVTPVPSPEGPR